MKKLLTLLLVVAMVLGIVSSAMAATTPTPSTVAGAAFSDIAGNDAEAAITLLKVESVMKGDAGTTTARPNDPISRAEYAAMVVRMLGKESLATSLASMKPTTKDEIPSWAWGYVNVAQSMGIMKGDPDGSFRPLANVTFAEALAMLERAIGQDKKVVGTWPTNVLLVAYDLDLVDGVEVFANTPATRGEIAIMMVNTMNTDKFLGYDENGDENTADSILFDKTVTGVVSSVAPNTNDINIGGAKKLAEKVNLVGAKTFEDLLNVNVTAIMNSDDEIVYIEVTDDANVIVGTLDEFTTNDDDEPIIVLNDGKEYVVDTANVDITINSKTGFVWANRAKIDHDATVVLNLVDDEVVFITATQVSYTDTIADDKATVDSDDDELYYLDTEAADNLEVAIDTPVTIDGVSKKVTDLKADDVLDITVEAAADGDDDTVFVLSIKAFRATVKGEITRFRTAASGNSVTLKLADGTIKTYSVSDNATFAWPPVVGANVEYRLNGDGDARVLVGAESASQVVLVTDWYVQNSGENHWYAEIDNKGVAKTIEINQALYTEIATAAAGAQGDYLFYTYDDANSDGVVTDAESTPVLAANLEAGEVVSVDAANGIVIVKWDDDADAATPMVAVILGDTTSGLVAYQADESDADFTDDSFEYTALSELSAGDDVYFDNTALNTIIIPD